MSRHVVVGTAGHIDHGKTALVRALTGTDTDRLAEEKRRGITIDLGFAHMALPDGGLAGIVDVPGHEDFIRNMVAGAAGIDVALLVVAADEGMMPQTHEHLAILTMLGVERGLVALTKTDLVDPEWLELAREDLRGGLAGSPLEDAPVVPVSARTGAGVDALRDTIVEVAEGAREREPGLLFRLPVDRGFTVRGTGTVVTGTVRDGRVSVGDAVVVLPAGVRARVRGLQNHGVAVESAGPATRAALALAGVDRADVPRGSWIVSEGWPPTRRITARVRVVDGSRWRVAQRQRVRVHVGTAEVMARVVVLGGEAIEPGETGTAQLRLERPVVVRAGDRFVLRSYSPVTTIGGGIVLEPIPPRRSRLDAHARDLLAALAGDAWDEALALLVRSAGGEGIPAAELPIRLPGVAHPTAGTGARIPERTRGDRTAPPGVLRLGDRLYHANLLADAEERLVERVREAHRESPLRPGLDQADARRSLGLPESLAEAVVANAIDAGRIESRDGLLALPEFAAAPAGGQREALLALEMALRDAGLEPPPPSDLPDGLAQRSDLRELIGYLEREGRIQPFPPDRWLHADALAQARLRLVEGLGGRDGLAPSDFREVFALSRKNLIPLLELFDRRGWTRRDGDLRAVPADTTPSPTPGP